MGTFAIQIAKAHGAEVTAVDGPGKLDVVCHRSPADYRRALRPGGFCGVVGGSAGRLVEVTILGQTLRRSAGRRAAW